jgi:hypothetical protein
MSLRPDETELIGSWVMKDGSIVRIVSVRLAFLEKYGVSVDS